MIELPQVGPPDSCLSARIHANNSTNPSGFHTKTHFCGVLHGDQNGGWEIIKVAAVISDSFTSQLKMLFRSIIKSNEFGL